ncbi:YheC/YheD family protein [Paenibacillus hamazuiensis]|uniref:YheC/YheD family endospore coat-associated protein n=1 Tax=Paenibacillus hamazuiensis TaxID=2936508 RepID=UPI002010BE42|nr:YheC/YheD family protein [Paenibacillus hamazuiensis]
MDSPYVGIMVGDKMYSRIPSGKTRHEAIHYYHDAGKRYGLTPAFFRMRDYNPEQKCVTAYINENGRYVAKKIPVPAVIHNRAIYPSDKEFRELEAWERSGLRIFNRWNRFGKLHVHETLMMDPALRPHLPGTFPATRENIAAMMKMYDQIIIKPDRSSIGRGVMKLERCPGGWQLTYPVTLSVQNNKWRNIRFRNALPRLLLRRLAGMKYIVQQCLPLATYRGRPFDMRVSVQRGAGGEWQVTGIVAKVAGKAVFLTNVAKGGSVYRLEHILQEEYPHLSVPEVMRGVADFSLSVARRLSSQLPHLADLGLDIGITTSGFPLFVECNGKDQRYSFRKAGMMEEWRSTYFNPIAYAKYLLDSGDTPPM